MAQNMVMVMVMVMFMVMVMVMMMSMEVMAMHLCLSFLACSEVLVNLVKDSHGTSHRGRADISNTGGV